MSTTSMAIFSNPLFTTYSVYARNASNAPMCRDPASNKTFKTESRFSNFRDNCQTTVQKIYSQIILHPCHYYYLENSL